MKLVRQTCLWFQEGTSDKVYEVDLCEVGAGKYVVNFRYGKRNAALRDGTKTPAAIAQAKAEDLFTKLVQSKTSEGYRITSETVGTSVSALSIQPQSASTPSSPKRAAPTSATPEGRAAEILRRLEEAVRTGKLFVKRPAAAKSARRGAAKPVAKPAVKASAPWGIDRVIWRAGELRLQEAAPHLIRLADFSQSTDSLTQYTLAWALGRCGDGDDRNGVIAQLTRFQTDTYPIHVRRIAASGLAQLLTGHDREAWINQVSASLPADLRGELKQFTQATSPTAFRAALESHLGKGDTSVLETLYLLAADNKLLRAEVMERLRTLVFVPPAVERYARRTALPSDALKTLRHIFKLAEHQDDGEVFGIVAYRFEKTKEMFSYSRWGGYSTYHGNQYVKAEDELKKPDSVLAYSNKTRTYLRTRVRRTLRRYGESEMSEPYIKLAVGVLLAYSDEADATPPRKTRRELYRYRTRQTQVFETHYDSFAPYWAFNFILFGNSPRYELKPATKAWRCKAPYMPDKPAPDKREEAFPALWDNVPAGLFHLLAESRVERVHQFAVKALRANPKAMERIDADFIGVLLSKPYEVTFRLGLELVEKFYNPAAPDKNLIRVLIASPLEEARRIARTWIERAPTVLTGDSALLSDLILSKYADVYEWLRQFLFITALTDEQSKMTIGRTLAALLAMKSDAADGAVIVREAGITLIGAFKLQLSTIKLDVVSDLLSHPLTAVQELGAKILLIHTTPVEQFPNDTLSALTQASSPDIRKLGIELFGKLPETLLIERKAVLIAFCISPFAEVREAARPVVVRLAEKNIAFGAEVSSLFLPLLLQKESAQGVHLDVAELLRQPSLLAAAEITVDTVFDLLHSRYAPAQQLGLVYLNERLADTDLTLRQIIKLGGHEFKEARERAWRFYQSQTPRIKADAGESLRLLDSKWDDTRLFAFEYFRTTFTKEDWSPKLLVSVCDSVRDDVQQFGRDLITRFFTEPDGTEYLLKLSQHPAPALQLYATNYLERFAADNTERLAQLESFFITVLSQVNRAGVAKARVLEFLKREALKSHEAAQVAARILTRQSLTMAIGAKASCLEVMRDIRNAYPDIELPIRIKPVENRTAELTV